MIQPKQSIRARAVEGAECVSYKLLRRQPLLMSMMGLATVAAYLYGVSGQTRALASSRYDHRSLPGNRGMPRDDALLVSMLGLPPETHLAFLQKKSTRQSIASSGATLPGITQSQKDSLALVRENPSLDQDVAMVGGFTVAQKQALERAASKREQIVREPALWHRTRVQQLNRDRYEQAVIATLRAEQIDRLSRLHAKVRSDFRSALDRERTMQEAIEAVR